MTEEEKQVIAAEEQKANAEPIEGEEGEADNEQEVTPKIDYEAELVKERERREKAEKKLAEENWKYRRVKPKVKEDDKPEEDEENKPLSRSELADFLVEHERKTEKRALEETAKSIARSFAGSDAEADLILEYWRNRVIPSGNLSEDIEIAHAAVNRKKILATNSEMKRSLAAKKNTYSGGSHFDGMQNKEVKLSAADAMAIKAAGFKWNGKNSTYEKPLGTKKVLVYDVKSKMKFVREV